MKFIEVILKSIGWVPKRERDGGQVDLENCYALFDINDASQLLNKIIGMVPDDSVWSIEGVYGKEIINTLRKFEHEDNEKVNLGTAWPRQSRIKVLLTKISKSEIQSQSENWDLDRDIIHQHIYKNNEYYFTSYDNLKSGCVWITNKIGKGKIEDLIQAGIIGGFDEYPNEDEN